MKILRHKQKMAFIKEESEDMKIEENIQSQSMRY